MGVYLFCALHSGLNFTFSSLLDSRPGNSLFLYLVVKQVPLYTPSSEGVVSCPNRGMGPDSNGMVYRLIDFALNLLPVEIVALISFLWTTWRNASKSSPCSPGQNF